MSLGSAAAGLFAARKRKGGEPLRDRIAGSWIGRRLAVERALARCQQELADDRESFARQLAGRDEEIAYLMAKATRLVEEGRRNVRETDHVSAHLSAVSAVNSTNSPTNSPPAAPASPKSPANSPRSPAKTPRSTKDR